MTSHKFVYQCEGSTFSGERIPQQEIIIQSECSDLDAHEILSLFKSYMLAIGYAEKSFYDACEAASKEGSDEWSPSEEQYEEAIKIRYLDKIKKRNEFKELLS